MDGSSPGSQTLRRAALRSKSADAVAVETINRWAKRPSLIPVLNRHGPGVHLG